MSCRQLVKGNILNRFLLVLCSRIEQLSCRVRIALCFREGIRFPFWPTSTTGLGVSASKGSSMSSLRIPLKVTSRSLSKLPVNPVQKYHPIHGKVTAWAEADERSLGATRRGGGRDILESMDRRIRARDAVAARGLGADRG